MVRWDDLLPRGHRKLGATVEDIERAERALGVTLPADYCEALGVSNGCEGELPWTYLSLWSTEQIVELNSGYRFTEFLPGFLGIGSDGGGEAFGYDMRNGKWYIVQVPMIGIEWSEAGWQGGTFGEFLRKMHRPAPRFD